jgi:hypothetical protein
VTRITLQDGKVVLRDGKVGTEEACCCGDCEFVGCRIYYSPGGSNTNGYEFNYWNGILSFDPVEFAAEPTCQWWGQGASAPINFRTNPEEIFPGNEPQTICGSGIVITGADHPPGLEFAPESDAAFFRITQDCCNDFLPPYRGEIGNQFDPFVPMPFVEVDCEEFEEFFPNLPRCNLPP